MNYRSAYICRSHVDRGERESIFKPNHMFAMLKTDKPLIRLGQPRFSNQKQLTSN